MIQPGLGSTRDDFQSLLVVIERLVALLQNLKRFLADERASYPKMPLGYFDRETRTLLAAYRERAVSGTRPVLMPSFPVVAKGKLHHSWRCLAIQLYANWLSYLGEQKAGNLRPLNSSALHNNRARIDSAHPHLLPS